MPQPAETNDPLPIASDSGSALSTGEGEGGEDAAEQPRARRTRASPLDAYRDQMGAVADEVIAEQAGVTRQGVRQYRERHGIPLAEGLQPRRGRPRVRPADGEPGEDLEGEEDAAAAGSPGAPVRKRKRRSKLDPYRDEVGKIPDAALAEKAGVTVQAVRQYRLLHNIPLDPSADRRRSAPAEPPPPPAAPAAPPAASERAPAPEAPAEAAPPAAREIQLTPAQVERIDAYEGLVGEVHDQEIAAMAEVSPALVQQYRRARGIPAAWAAEQPAAAPVAAAGAHAFAVRIRAGDQESEYALFAADLVAAAVQAAAVIAAWPSGGTLLAVRYIGPALA